MYRVFSQSPGVLPDEHAVIVQARAHFDAELSFPLRQITGQGDGELVTLEIDVLVRGDDEACHVHARVRRATETDWVDADQAEIKGKAGGMALLARRCKTLWEVDDPLSPRHALALCGAIATATLGPVMPPGNDTLFGTRGARERLEKLRASPGPLPKD